MKTPKVGDKVEFVMQHGSRAGNSVEAEVTFVYSDPPKTNYSVNLAVPDGEQPDGTLHIICCRYDQDPTVQNTWHWPK